MNDTTRRRRSRIGSEQCPHRCQVHQTIRMPIAPYDSQLLVNFAAKGGDSSYLYATTTQQPYQRFIFLCWRSLRSYCLRPMVVRGGGMGGKNEKTRIEAFASPGRGKMPRATKRPRKKRGMPLPATFDIDTLPGSSNLTALEAAAVIRRTPGALEQWRRDRNHPLKWRHVDGRPLYRVDAVRDYLARCDKATKTPPPHNAREDDRAAQP